MAYDPDRVVAQLGRRIAQLRRERDLSQGRLAAKLGTTSQWVSQLERGTASPTVHTLVKICNALDVSLAELFAKAPPDRSKKVSAEVTEGALARARRSG